MSSGVEFDEDKFSFGKPPSASRTPGAAPTGYGHADAPASAPPMVRWLIKKGIVKSPAMAQGLLVVIILINIVITYAIISYFL